jgi:NDP-sugar pyrophosphorylase family protein
MDVQSEAKATQVVSLCGGKAKRFGYSELPKPLLPFGEGHTLLDYQINFFTGNGFSDFVFLVGHMHEKISEHLKVRNYPITARFSVDPPQSKVGKGKALKHALLGRVIDRNRRAFVAYPDDIFTEKGLPSRALVEHLAARRRDGSIIASVIVSPGTPYPFGVVKIDANHKATSFEEKPMVNMLTSTGMYILEPECFPIIEKIVDMSSPDAVEFETTLMHKLAAEGKLNVITVPQGVWLPINNPKEYETALAKMRKMER